eukprot:CAMPEP_0195063204 /NCGR_PEP_ID=MMETSP0448-20130528/9625_1 /TAXON_ID=66468 /ORGANISM="Heterocapsa triquestra, Strain CCMP 448" /LENGTH=95 /DNA_ID=CAMNT_0040094031 /DNA_START=134 /DNA_END=421 /DNA_ORIENTATION=-
MVHTSYFSTHLQPCQEVLQLLLHEDNTACPVAAAWVAGFYLSACLSCRRASHAAPFRKGVRALLSWQPPMNKRVAFCVGSSVVSRADAGMQTRED